MAFLQVNRGAGAPNMFDPATIYTATINMERAAQGLPPIGVPSGSSQPNMPASYGSPANTIPTARDQYGNVVPPWDAGLSSGIEQAVAAALHMPHPIPITSTVAAGYEPRTGGGAAASQAGGSVTGAGGFPRFGLPNYMPPQMPGFTAPAGGGGSVVDPRSPQGAGLTPPTITYNIVPHVQGMTTQQAQQLSKAILASQNIDYNALSKTARKEAVASVKQQVNMLRAQQAQINQQATNAARTITAANDAIVMLNQNLPKTLQDSYDRAAATIGGLSAGVGNQITNLASQGAGITPTGQDLGALAQNMGSTLAFQGQDAKAALAQQGLAAAQTQLASNKVFEGTGLQGAKLALAQGANQAAAINPDIQQTIASLPALTQQNLASLSSAARADAAAREKALVDAYKASGLLTPAAAAAINARIDIANTGAENRANIAAAQLWGKLATSKGTQPRAPQVHYSKDGSIWVFDPNTSQVEQYRGPQPTPAKALSATEVRQRNKALSSAVDVAVNGSPVITHLGPTGTPTRYQEKGGMTPLDAFRYLASQFPWASAAEILKRLKTAYQVSASERYGGGQTVGPPATDAQGNIVGPAAGYPQPAGTGPLASVIVGGGAFPQLVPTK